ncbi:PREDICTED: dolichol phosphate-mannose biosynthesis regulatory protein isoform X2 [Cercocebus atys]|uniref:dolichol phosphate-mannose biosynthesis regulatory protein isoform X2 n=1 Tax=Cercocebus atys TaxID=9531 RepID=UPI0005F50528|nr:PREDICTED: dolichol phosphate-mannose biosynthesis regulatory protein isoform X2 [Cercocebus atys]
MWLAAPVTERAGKCHSSTVSMSSTSISCPEPMLSPSHWLQASYCSCLWSCSSSKAAFLSLTQPKTPQSLLDLERLGKD